MKRILIILTLILLPTLASAQSQRNPCYYPAANPASGSSGCIPVSTVNPLPVTATATIGGGFTDAATGTPISVTTGGNSGTLPAGSVVAAFNVGTTNPAYCKLGASATTSDIYLAPGGGWFAFSVGSSTQLTCISTGGSTTVNMIGGSGLPTGSGGGSGGGGGGAVTIASGAVASGAYSSGSIASGAFASGSIANGADVVEGTITTAHGCATSGYTVIGCLGQIDDDVKGPVLVTVNGTAIGATGLTPGVSQTGTVVGINTDQTSLGGVAYGAMANYGTSPGAVKVPGVNAFITNSPTFSGSVFGPTAVGSANANPPVVIGGTATGAAGQNVQGLSVVAPSVAPVTATNTAVVVDLRPDSPGIIALGPANVAQSVPQTISSQYPTNATTTTPTAVTATSTGTTAATAASLGATASVTNYVCGFDITADATALAIGTATLSGTISGSLNYLQNISALTTGAAQLTRTFNPCIPASAANTAITITSAAAGSGGNTIVNIWGYRL